MEQTQEPIIIQGGMGVAVSAWPLAKAVAETCPLGVVSGTALDAVLRNVNMATICPLISSKLSRK